MVRMRMTPVDSYVWVLGPQIVELLGGTRNCGLIVGSVSLVVDLEVSKDLCFLPSAFCSSYELSDAPAFIFPSWALNLWNYKLNEMLSFTSCLCPGLLSQS